MLLRRHCSFSVPPSPAAAAAAASRVYVQA